MSTMRPQKVFISRTTRGLADTALQCEAILKERGCIPIHQPDFTGSWRDVKGMLVDKLIECDAVICLIGPARTQRHITFRHMGIANLLYAVI